MITAEESDLLTDQEGSSSTWSRSAPQLKGEECYKKTSTQGHCRIKGHDKEYTTESTTTSTTSREKRGLFAIYSQGADTKGSPPSAVY